MIYNSFSGGDSSISGGVSTIGDLFKAFGAGAARLPADRLHPLLRQLPDPVRPAAAARRRQIKGYEPGDADWGVKMADVRGQAEAKEEITRVVSLWQSGEEFEKAGGKRERGVLFLGAPGTGKTMLSKGIATSFNCPFVSIPGSGFAQTFIGMDAVLVRYLAFKAKRLARKWGGQCIVFIDEIDAVGMRRQSLGSGFQPLHGSLAPRRAVLRPAGRADVGRRPRAGDGGVARAHVRRCAPSRAAPAYPPAIEKIAGAVRDMMMPGMMGGGGGLALNQLLVVMDGIDDPPLMKRMRTKRINTWLDALYIVPRRIGKRSLRLQASEAQQGGDLLHRGLQRGARAARPRAHAPGPDGPPHLLPHAHVGGPARHLRPLPDKVAHAEALDTPRKRDELARVTNGYSPAMIDQVCSMALTYAHSDGRQAFEWEDLLEAMTTVESGVAVGQPYAKHEERSIAIHEAGHAVCSPPLRRQRALDAAVGPQARGLGRPPPGDAGRGPLRRVALEQIAGLIWSLGAMAAEYVFYDQTTTGVGGDVYSTTAHAVGMVGHPAMGPTPVDLSDRIEDRERREEEEERLMKRFEKLGTQIMHRSGGSMMNDDGVSGVLADGGKRSLAAALIGQAFVIAYNTIRHNREGTDYVASRARLRR